MNRDGLRGSPPSIGMIGFGAFGRLAASHLSRYFSVRAHDPAGAGPGDPSGIPAVGLAEAARSDIVVLAVPVGALKEAVAAIAPHLRPGTLVLDVGSVKVGPARIMRDGLPPHVDILATHPLFGPQSAGNGLGGLKIAVCPLRGRAGWRAAAFLRKSLALRVIVTTPERHDREAAISQGLTHLIAKVLAQMGPLPTAMTTRSFDMLLEAVGMVRDDPATVFDAITRANPYAAEVRHRFLELAGALESGLREGG